MLKESHAGWAVGIPRSASMLEESHTGWRGWHTSVCFAKTVVRRSAISMLQRKSYVGRLSVCCKEIHTSVGYQCVAKTVIQEDVVRLSVCCKDSHIEWRGSAIRLLQRQSYRMTWFGYQVVVKTVIQDDVVRLSGCCKDSHTGWRASAIRLLQRQLYRMTCFGYQDSHTGWHGLAISMLQRQMTWSARLCEWAAEDIGWGSPNDSWESNFGLVNIVSALISWEWIYMDRRSICSKL